MKKNTLKFFIDILLFINISSIAVLGFLLGFIIPKGKQFLAAPSFLGLHRHEWGHIHLRLSFILVVLLVLHIWFNKTWIAQSAKHYFGSRWKHILWGISCAWIIVLFVGWIMMK